VSRPREAQSRTTGKTNAASAGSLSETDLARALGVAEGKSLRKGRKRRCVTCGLAFSTDEVHPDFDEEGRRSGWVCDGCY
jgi:hypothetical protein